MGHERQYYVSVYFNLYDFRQQTGRQKMWCIQKRRNKLRLLQFVTINWLINSIEHSLFWVGNGSFASQDSPRILWNLDSFYRSQAQAICPTLRQVKAFHRLHPISLSVFEYYIPIYNYIFTLVCFPQVFFHQNPVCISSLSHACDRFGSLRSAQTLRLLITQIFTAWVSSPRLAVTYVNYVHIIKLHYNYTLI